MFFKKKSDRVAEFTDARNQYDTNRAKKETKQDKERRKRFDKMFAKIRKSMVSCGYCAIEKEDFEKAKFCGFMTFPFIRNADRDGTQRKNAEETFVCNGDYEKFIAEAREAGLVVKFRWNQNYQTKEWAATALTFTFKRDK